MLQDALLARPARVPCPDCGKIFSRKSYMDNHYKLIHVRKSQHYCELCDKHFINGYAIRTHKKFVHEKYEKPKNKICDICGRGFHTNRVLINHKRTHTGERPHKCSYCPAAFAQNVARKTHEKTQHKHLLQELKGFSA
ncbi:jg20097 [Pararge aegeria aegeria]|uniref:Jg20097 protein n=1 Tax=Pararge aegeria aegeria TaxID=348720 RepID=A0A8S4S887_9NEOP|nr:jg20097 [Pararge aegeria aegeria]